MTTEEPSTSFAECTWAIDAAAMGTGSIKLKILSILIETVSQKGEIL